MDPKPFRVCFERTFHSSELYDQAGREVYDLGDACRVAEELYGESWKEVYNGQFGLGRDEWVQQQCDHNEMVRRPGDAEFAWQCAKCGYLYGRHP